jgi:hypothetical protein
MSRVLLALASIVLCGTVPSAAADPAGPLHTNRGEELHAAVTDVPEIVDMSYADPKTWHNLPPAAQVGDQSPAPIQGPEELQFPTQQPSLALTMHWLF